MQNFIVFIAIITLIIVQTNSFLKCYICVDNDCGNPELKTCPSDYLTTTPSPTRSTTTIVVSGQDTSSVAPPPPVPTSPQVKLRETFYCVSIQYNNSHTGNLKYDDNEGEYHVRKDCTANSQFCEDYMEQENVECVLTQAVSDSEEDTNSTNAVYISTRILILVVINKIFI